jgi:hypothetical protein
VLMKVLHEGVGLNSCLFAHFCMDCARKLPKKC